MSISAVGRSSGSAPASATMHGRSFLSATRSDLWSRARLVVTVLTFVSCMRRRWWDSTGAILRKVCRPTRDRIVMIDANGRLGEAITNLLGNSCRPDFDDNGYSLLDFMHNWDMEPRPLLSRFRFRRGHPEQARSMRSTPS